MSESTASITFTIHGIGGILLATATSKDDAAKIWTARAPDHPIVLGADSLPAELDPMAGPPPCTPAERATYRRWRRRALEQVRTPAGRLAMQLGVAPQALAYHLRQARESYEAWHGRGWYQRVRGLWRWVAASVAAPAPRPGRIALDAGEVAHA